MIDGKKFIQMVRNNRLDMDDRLAEIFNKNLENVSSRSYRKAWFTINKQKCFAKKNLAAFLNEIAILKEKGAKLNLSGESLDNWVIKEYMKDEK